MTQIQRRPSVPVLTATMLVLAQACGAGAMAFASGVPGAWWDVPYVPETGRGSATDGAVRVVVVTPPTITVQYYAGSATAPVLGTVVMGSPVTVNGCSVEHPADYLARVAGWVFPAGSNGSTVSATLSCSAGFIRVPTLAAGATMTGNDSAAVTVSGTVAQVNATIASFTLDGAKAGSAYYQVTLRGNVVNPYTSVSYPTVCNSGIKYFTITDPSAITLPAAPVLKPSTDVPVHGLSVSHPGSDAVSVTIATGGPLVTVPAVVDGAAVTGNGTASVVVTGSVAAVNQTVATFYLRASAAGSSTVTVTLAGTYRGNATTTSSSWTSTTEASPGATVLSATGATVIEGEAFHHANANGIDHWEVVDHAGASGGKVVLSHPDRGMTSIYTDVKAPAQAALDSVPAGTAPSVSYLLDVQAPGTYVVWMKAAGDGNGDSVHVGVDGVADTRGKNLTAFLYPGKSDRSELRWSCRMMNVSNGKSTAGSPVTVTFASAGLHTLDIWPRKDGVRIDQVMLTPVGTATAGTAGDLLPTAVGQMVVVADASKASTTTAGSHIWKAVADPLGSGRTVMTVYPDIGLPPTAGQIPSLVFNVYLPRAGTWRVWVRGSAPDKDGDSVSLGLDGVAQSSAAGVTGLSTGTAANWVSSTVSGKVPTLTVAAAGHHQVQVWMREDGVRVDQIALATESSWRPGSDALAESVRGAPFQQDAAGVLAMEAEHAHTVRAGSLDQFTATTLPGAVGGTAMVAGPDDGTVGTVPALGFHAYFRQAGTYHVWVRGAAPDANGDSVNIGMNGSVVPTADKITGFAFSGDLGTWTWSKSTMDGDPATITVPSAGDRSIQVFMREDGFAIDRLLIAPAGTVPSGDGPAESEQSATPPAGTT